MQIERPHSAAIIFRESRKGSAVFVGIASAVILAWEWMVWGCPTTVADIGNMAMANRNQSKLIIYMLAGVPVFLLPLVLRRLAVAIFGRVITFDSLSRRVTKNNRIVAGFDEIHGIRLKKWDDGYVRLHIFLKSGKKIRLGKICHTREYDKVQNDIGHLLHEAEKDVDSMESPSTKDFFIPLSLLYYSVRAFSMLFLLASLLLPLSTMIHLTERLKFQGNVWAGSIFLFVFGAIFYGVSRFLKYLRHAKW